MSIREWFGFKPKQASQQPARSPFKGYGVMGYEAGVAEGYHLAMIDILDKGKPRSFEDVMAHATATIPDYLKPKEGTDA